MDGGGGDKVHRNLFLTLFYLSMVNVQKIKLEIYFYKKSVNLHSCSIVAEAQEPYVLIHAESRQ
jgi:hypothetical protein